MTASTKIVHQTYFTWVPVPEQEQQEKIRNISLEEIVVHLAKQYNRHLYQWYSYAVKYSLHLTIIEPFKDYFCNVATITLDIYKFEA
jgi:hypothetical protein